MDFYCPSEKLVIELDGAHHFTPSGEQHDQSRDAYLLSLGIKVLRFENEVIHHKIDIAVEAILNEFEGK